MKRVRVYSRSYRYPRRSNEGFDGAGKLFGIPSLVRAPIAPEPNQFSQEQGQDNYSGNYSDVIQTLIPILQRTSIENEEQEAIAESPYAPPSQDIIIP